MVIALSFILSVLMVMVFGCGVMLYRNNLVFKFRMKANDMCFRMGDWEEYNKAPSYNSMMWDWSKWKFEDFFPGLKEE